MRTALLTAMLLLGLPAVAFASQTDGTVSATTKYAWGENMGWINFAPQNGDTYTGIHITDTAVTGYAWSAAVGWINFSPTNSGQGVTNTSDGHLGGYAWIATKGWLSMSGVSINSSGKITGIAGTEGSTVGRVSFDCTQCNVTTDWRPTSARSEDTPPPSPPPAAGGPIAVATNHPVPATLPVPTTAPASPNAAPSAGDTAVPAAPVSSPDPIAQFYRDIIQTVPALRADLNHVESYDKPLRVEPQQTGLVVGQFVSGVGAAVEIPRNVSTGALTISITARPLAVSTATTALVAMGGVAFDVTAVDSQGNAVHSFNHLLKITLVVPQSLQGRSDIGVYWFDPGSNNWVLVPDVTFTGRTASFTVAHLTRFAVLGDRIAVSQPTLPPKTAVNEDWLWLLVVLIVVYIAQRWYRHTRDK